MKYRDEVGCSVLRRAFRLLFVPDFVPVDREGSKPKLCSPASAP